jgi:hypothetical protein
MLKDSIIESSRNTAEGTSINSYSRMFSHTLGQSFLNEKRPIFLSQNQVPFHGDPGIFSLFVDSPTLER